MEREEMREKIIEMVRDAVVKRFGADRIKEINAFGPYEGEDLNIIVLVEGIDERKDKYVLEVSRKLRHKFWNLGLDVPLAISKAEKS
ncbi:MAG: hypothetical protein ACE5J9_06155 [Methanosarcinales archaeon]